MVTTHAVGPLELATYKHHDEVADAHMMDKDERCTTQRNGRLQEPGASIRASELRLALVDGRTLVRTAVAHLLEAQDLVQASAGTLTVLPFSTLAEFEAHYRSDPYDVSLVAVSFEPTPLSAEAAVRQVRALLGGICDLPVILMSDSLEATAGIELLRRGIKGYLPATLSLAVTIEALHLVRAGGTFIPPDLLQAAPPATLNHVAQPAPESFSANQLTTRQNAVVALLRQGKPNKIIAADLGIREGTVKVYVRQIMKKLGATNRTHACFLLQQSAEMALHQAAVVRTT